MVSVITVMIYRAVLDETLNQSFNLWPRSNVFMQEMIEKIVKVAFFIAPISAFIKQCKTSIVEQKLNRELPVIKEISLPPGRSLSASTDITLDEEFKARRSHCR